MTQHSAQASMRANYINGGPGVVVSGLVWVLAFAVTYKAGFRPGIICFFFAGMLIYPLSVVISNIVKPKDTSAPNKRLMREAVMNLPILFGGLWLAYVMSRSDPALFYPIMAVAIGLRYLLFQRLYGLSVYWALGLVLMTAGAAGLYHGALAPASMALSVGIVELIFGLIIWKRPVL